MRLQNQPNPWTCTITSAAIVIDHPVSDLIELAGHSGDLVLETESPPYDRPGHAHSEVADILYELGYHTMFIEADPQFLMPSGKAYRLYNDDDFCRERIIDYIKNHNGILSGSFDGKPHSVAVVDKTIYDPRGQEYSFLNGQVFDLYNIEPWLFSIIISCGK